MPNYRITVERVVVTREIIECNAPTIHAAAARVRDFLNAERKPRRGLTITRPHDDDPTATVEERVVQAVERS